MSGQIDIFNLALANIGSGASVSSPDERSPERITCSRWYDLAVETVLADFPWRFATTEVDLANIGDPPMNWEYRYRYPNDCLRAMRIIVPGVRNPQRDQEIDFEVQYDPAGRSIVTDQEDARLQYIVRINSAERFPPQFVEVLALKLASMIVMQLADDRTKKSDLLNEYERWKQEAQASSLNEGDDTFISPSPYERAMA